VNAYKLFSSVLGMTIKKPAREIVFKPEPFFTCLISALEAYKRETYGLLFSRNTGNTIDFAYTMQLARKTFVEVYVNDKLERYIIREAEEDFGLRFIGDFHSHTDYKGKSTYKSGETDTCGLRENPDKIALILGLSSDQEKFIEMLMRVYYYDSEQKRIRKAKLILPKRLETILSVNNFSLLNFFRTPQR